MVIDIHTHTFPDKIAASTVHKLGNIAHTFPQTNATNMQLCESMKEAGIDISVILPVATHPRQVEKINLSARRMNDSFAQTGLFSLGAMHPAYENYEEELEKIKESGLKGIKLHPVYQGMDIDDPHCIRLLKKARDLDLLVVTHAGEDIGYPGVSHCSPKMCRNVLDQIPDLKFVLAHMGGWNQWDEVHKYLLDTDAYLDTAFSVYPVHAYEDAYWKENHFHLMQKEEFLEMIKVFGADRILFGTDCPWANQKEYMDLMKDLPLSEEERNKIFGENANRLLKLV